MVARPLPPRARQSRWPNRRPDPRQRRSPSLLRSGRLPTSVPRRRGLRRGCLIALLVVAIVILVPIGLFLRIPQQFGLFRAHPEAIFSQTPDPFIGQAVTDALKQSGSPTAGLRIYVFRDPESKGHAAYATAALAENFSFRDTGGRRPILRL